MKFQKYSSIENSYRQKTLDEIVLQGLSGGEWVCELKIHGANFSFWYDGAEIRCAKRSSFVGEDGGFFNWQAVRDRYQEFVKKAFDLYKERYRNDFTFITICGELAGGSYPNQKSSAGTKKVQNGIWYCPENEFFAFDIFTDFGLLNVDVRNELLKEAGFPYIQKPLFRGSLKECLEYPNEFPDPTYKLFGLPEVENNICEGVVIKPVEPKFFGNGSRVILKNKNEVWGERTVKPKGKKPCKIPKELPENIRDISQKMLEYINTNRLKNILSKTGEVTNKDFGIVLKLFNQDVLEDFQKDNESFSLLEKEDKKILTKILSNSTSGLLRKNFLNIIDGTF